MRWNLANLNFVMSCLIFGGKYGPKKTCSLICSNLKGYTDYLGPLPPFQRKLWHFENCYAMWKSLNFCIFTPTSTHGYNRCAHVPINRIELENLYRTHIWSVEVGIKFYCYWGSTYQVSLSSNQKCSCYANFKISLLAPFWLVTLVVEIMILMLWNVAVTRDQFYMSHFLNWVFT